MKTFKKNHFIMLLLITISSNLYVMAPEENNPPRWISLAADVILYSTDALKEFLSYIHSEPITTSPQPEPSKFVSFPIEIQQTIIFFLSQRNSATTLKDAAYAINSLAQVNKQLNNLINNPQFCLHIIKSLAQQFNCSDEAAAEALSTKEAKNRLVVQKKFEELFAYKKFDKKLFDQLYTQYHKYVDLNFTYRDSQKIKFDNRNTILIIAAKTISPQQKIKFESLLNTNAIDINYRGKEGIAALMECAGSCQNPDALQILCNAPNIIIDLKDNYQSTALHFACWNRNKYKAENKGKFIEILLNADADPEAMNEMGLTPKMIIKKTSALEYEAQELKLINDAIGKKHEKK